MSGIIINEDFENFMASYPPESMTEAGLREQIDHYATGQVEQICFCGNGMSAVFDSTVFETLWGKAEYTADGRMFYRGKEIGDRPLPVKASALNSRLLHRNVENPFQKRIDYGRRKGRAVWMSMRMNDVHWASDDDFLMNSDYWREHPELHRAEYNRNSWSARALDYGQADVRRHFLALAKEYLERFDLDGLELDWMRTPPHLRPGFEIQDAGLITDFMREVRNLADQAQERLGHEVRIGVRLPARPEDARLTGLDFRAWTRANLVDLVVVTSYWASTDFNMPLELWKALLPDTVTLAAGLEILARPNLTVPPFFNTPEIVAGYAASFLHRGADKIYLFNHMDGHVGMKDKTRYRDEILQKAGALHTVGRLARRHLITYTDEKCRAEGIALDPILPLTLSEHIFAPLRLNLGGDTAGRKACVILGLDCPRPLEPDDLTLRMNTGLCERQDHTPRLDMPENNWQLRAFAVPPQHLHDGNNMIEVIKNTATEISVQWCEVYLP